MEALLPSEIARLVLGYLEEQKCTDAAKVFLETCPHLQECRTVISSGRRFSTKVNGLTLMDIIEKFSAASQMVQERLNKVIDCEQRRPCGDLLEQLKFLVEETRSQRFVVNINVPSQNNQLQNGSPIISGSIRKRHHSNSERERNKRVARSNVHPVQQLSEPITSQVEATPLESLPGTIGFPKDSEQSNNVDREQSKGTSQEQNYQKPLNANKNTNDGFRIEKGTETPMQISSERVNDKRDCQTERLTNTNMLEKCTMATSTEELLSLCNTEVQTNPYEILESESDVNDDPIENLSFLTKELLNRTELQERIAENINKAILPADTSMKDESLCESPANEFNSSLMTNLNIKSIVKATESDPAFETFLDEIFGHPADTDTSPDEDAESRPCADLNDEIQEESPESALNNVNSCQLPVTETQLHTEGRGLEIPLKQRLRSSSRQQNQKSEDEVEKQKEQEKEQTTLEDHNAAAILSIINANIINNDTENEREGKDGKEIVPESIDSKKESNENHLNQTEKAKSQQETKQTEEVTENNNEEMKSKKIPRKTRPTKSKQETLVDKQILEDESMVVPTLIFCSKETIGNFIQINPPHPNIMPLPTTSTSHFIPIAPKDPNKINKPRPETVYLRTVKVPAKSAMKTASDSRNTLSLKPIHQQLTNNSELNTRLVVEQKIESIVQKIDSTVPNMNNPIFHTISTENLQVTKISSTGNSQLPKLNAVENEQINKLNPGENLQVTKIISAGSSQLNKLNSVESQEMDKVNSMENSEINQLNPAENSEINQLNPAENPRANKQNPQMSKINAVESITLYSNENSAGTLLESANVSAFNVDENMSLSGTGLSPYLKFNSNKANQNLSDIELGPYLENTKTTNQPTTSAPEKSEEGKLSKTEMIAKRTPRTLMKSRSKNHRLSLSTPRRRSSHVRALDFNTPTKSNSTRKVNANESAQYSPRPARNNNSICRTSLFKSPPFAGASGSAKLKSPLKVCRPCRVPVATRSPAPKLQGGWDKLNGIGVIIGDVSPQKETFKESVEEKQVRESALLKTSWDADLRKCIQVEEEEKPKPVKKRALVKDKLKTKDSKAPETKVKGKKKFAEICPEKKQIPEPNNKEKDLEVNEKNIENQNIKEGTGSVDSGKAVVKKYAQLKTLKTNLKKSNESPVEFPLEKSEFVRVSVDIVHQALPNMIDLETPRKDNSLGVPPTPRLLSPNSSVITPFVKLNEDSSKDMRSYVSTPDFPKTPCIALTPKPAEEDTTEKLKSESSCSTYFKPSSECKQAPGKPEITQFEVIKENLPRDEAVKEMKISSKDRGSDTLKSRKYLSESENETTDSDTSTSSDSSTSSSSSSSSSGSNASDTSTRLSSRSRKTPNTTREDTSSRIELSESLKSAGERLENGLLEKKGSFVKYVKLEVSPKKVFPLVKTDEQLNDTTKETPAKDDSALEADISETPSSSKAGMENLTNLSSKISALITSEKPAKPKIVHVQYSKPNTEGNILPETSNLINELAEKRQRLIAKFKEAPKAKFVKKTRIRRVSVKSKNVHAKKNANQGDEEKGKCATKDKHEVPEIVVDRAEEKKENGTEKLRKNHEVKKENGTEKLRKNPEGKKENGTEKLRKNPEGKKENGTEKPRKNVEENREGKSEVSGLTKNQEIKDKEKTDNKVEENPVKSNSNHCSDFTKEEIVEIAKENSDAGKVEMESELNKEEKEEKSETKGNENEAGNCVDEKFNKIRNFANRADSKTILKQKVEQVKRDLFSDEEIEQRPIRARQKEENDASSRRESDEPKELSSVLQCLQLVPACKNEQTTSLHSSSVTNCVEYQFVFDETVSARRRRRRYSNHELEFPVDVELTDDNYRVCTRVMKPTNYEEMFSISPKPRRRPIGRKSPVKTSADGKISDEKFLLKNFTTKPIATSSPVVKIPKIKKIGAKQADEKKDVVIDKKKQEFEEAQEDSHSLKSRKRKTSESTENKQYDKKSRTTDPQAHTALVKLNAVDLDEFLTTVHGKQ